MTRSTYVIHLELGTPPRRYPFQLDLASSDLLVASSLCTKDSCPDVRNEQETPVYIPGRSASFEAINSNATTFNLTYADGSGASGFLALERVGIVGSEGRVTVENQVIGVVNETTMDLQALGVSGIVGLGFARGSVFVREGLGGDQLASVSVTASRTSVTVSSSLTTQTTSALDSTSLFFSILPIETITPIPVPTSTSTLRRRATTPAYFPPLVENLFSHPSINTSSPRLAYPVFSLALANSSAPFGEANANASITWGGVSSAFVDNSTGRGLGDIDWVPVVPFARAVSTPLSNVTGGTELDVLEGEEYLYWTVPLGNISTNGTTLTPEPTYNSSLTGIDASIALLDAGTNGIYGPQQDITRLFSRIKDARQVSDGQWAVPCDTEMTLAFHISRTVITLQPSEWIYARVQGGSMCLAWPRVAPPAADGVDWQLGTPVLRKVVVVFVGGVSGVQAPLVGLLALPAVNATSTTGSVTPKTTVPTVQDASQIMEHLTKTINTALPNVVLPDPSYTTPPYAFTTPAPSLGALQSVGLGNPLVYQVEEVPVVQVSTSLPTETSGTKGSASPRPSDAAMGVGVASGAVHGPMMRGSAVWGLLVVGIAILVL